MPITFGSDILGIAVIIAFDISNTQNKMINIEVKLFQILVVEEL